MKPGRASPLPLSPIRAKLVDPESPGSAKIGTGASRPADCVGAHDANVARYANRSIHIHDGLIQQGGYASAAEPVPALPVGGAA